mmetsp:Transcript_108269/g.170720  ORF Transcript_108269/g.170720 Transcript_108269/m.170720 type:complete len:105 (-) Transcript_108269:65-379(-)
MSLTWNYSAITNVITYAFMLVASFPFLSEAGIIERIRLASQLGSADIMQQEVQQRLLLRGARSRQVKRGAHPVARHSSLWSQLEVHEDLEDDHLVDLLFRHDEL